MVLAPLPPMVPRPAAGALLCACLLAPCRSPADIETALPEEGDQAAAQARADARPVGEGSLRLRFRGGEASLDKLRLYQRATGRIGAWELAAVGERDPGERRWFDHVVGYAHRRPDSGGLEVALGSLRPAFGQGLLFGRGRSMGVPVPAPRRDGESVGYRSAAENRDLCGLFVRGRLRAVRFSLVAGGFRRDARLDTSGAAVSLPEDGTHTGTRRAYRNRLAGVVLGARATAGSEGARLGVTVQRLAFDRTLDLRRPGRVPSAFSGRGQGAAAIDGGAGVGRARLFGAAAIAGGRTAWVAGVTRVSTAGVRFDLLACGAAAGFFSPFGASVLGGGSGQRGVTARVRGRGWRLWLDETRRTAARWTEPVPGGSSGLGLSWRRRPVRRLEVTVDAQRRRSSGWSHGSQVFPVTERARLRGRWSPGDLRLEARLAGVRSGGRRGAALGLGGRRRTPRGEWSVQATRYRTGGYAARIYEYEQDLPGSVSIRPLYGDGWRVCALAGVRLDGPLGPLRIWLRGRLQARPLRRQAGFQIEVAEPR